MWSAASFLLAAGLFGPGAFFQVSAKYEPPAKGQTQGAVLVTFLQLESGVHVNEHPAPRLSLEAAQAVLDYKAPTAVEAPPADPALGKKLDLSQPVRFTVTPRAVAPKGEQSVKATVVYFYCSDREAWCRKGSEEVAFSVTVP
jgi:hypothetical protein